MCKSKVYTFMGWEKVPFHSTPFSHPLIPSPIEILKNLGSLLEMLSLAVLSASTELLLS